MPLLNSANAAAPQNETLARVGQELNLGHPASYTGMIPPQTTLELGDTPRRGFGDGGIHGSARCLHEEPDPLVLSSHPVFCAPSRTCKTVCEKPRAEVKVNRRECCAKNARVTRVPRNRVRHPFPVE
jgi:hypothetical protein